MRNGEREIVYDAKLRVEVYRFQGMAQPFPAHFHSHYVIGLVERGSRCVVCAGREQWAEAGDVLLFNPGESHACTQVGDTLLDYRAFNVQPDVLRSLLAEAAGLHDEGQEVRFSATVLHDDELFCALRLAHCALMDRDEGFDGEERLLLALDVLASSCTTVCEDAPRECRSEVARACVFMEAHFTERMTLDAVCRQAGLGKSALLRAFTQEKGITPYRYLETLRIDAARRLLEQGMPSLDVALRTGFYDQSHFTKRFTRLVGLSPGQYRDVFVRNGSLDACR